MDASVFVAMGVFVLVLLAVIGGVTLVVVRRLSARGERDARERFPNAHQIINGANYCGQESRGAGQWRGNGTLVLTDEELYFKQWVSQSEFRIPLRAIQSLETPLSHLGKTTLRPLLKVNYINPQGERDSMAWSLADVEGVKREVEKRLAVSD
jgi:hypothetical protein